MGCGSDYHGLETRFKKGLPRTTGLQRGDIRLWGQYQRRYTHLRTYTHTHAHTHAQPHTHPTHSQPPHHRVQSLAAHAPLPCVDQDAIAVRRHQQLGVPLKPPYLKEGERRKKYTILDTFLFNPTHTHIHIQHSHHSHIHTTHPVTLQDRFEALFSLLRTKRFTGNESHYKTGSLLSSPYEAIHRE